MYKRRDSGEYIRLRDCRAEAERFEDVFRRFLDICASSGEPVRR